MNLNILAHIIYLLSSGYITFYVGWKLFRHGIIYLNLLFPEKAAFCLMVNRILLLGYYLVNMGYLAISISLWPDMMNWQNVLETIVKYTGQILIILGSLHMLNLLVFYLISHYTKHKNKSYSH